MYCWDLDWMRKLILRLVICNTTAPPVQGDAAKVYSSINDDRNENGYCIWPLFQEDFQSQKLAKYFSMNWIVSAKGNMALQFYQIIIARFYRKHKNNFTKIVL